MNVCFKSLFSNQFLFPVSNFRHTMAEKRRFTTEIIARNILKKFFVSLIWSVILMITVTI